MQTKLSTYVIFTILILCCAAASVKSKQNSTCSSAFLQPSVCPFSAEKAKISTNKADTVRAFFKLVSKLLVKSFIKCSVKSFIKMILKEILSGVSNQFIRTVIQVIIKLFANIASNLLTYAFTQYLVKLIIRKIKKTADKVVRITVFKTFVKRGVKFVAGKFSRPFILHINQRAKLLIQNNTIINHSKLFIRKLKKLQSFKGLNKIRKIKLVKKYRKLLKRAWNAKNPIFKINQLVESPTSHCGDAKKLPDIDRDQPVIEKPVTYTVIEDNEEFTEIGVELEEQATEEVFDTHGKDQQKLGLYTGCHKPMDPRDINMNYMAYKWMLLLASIIGIHQSMSYGSVTKLGRALVHRSV